MTIGGIILLLVILAIIFPEFLIIGLVFIGTVGYGILEFILRLFGKTFDNVEPTDSQIKDAYINYADSHQRLNSDGLLSVTPMKHNYESFAEECRKNKAFFNRHKK